MGGVHSRCCPKYGNASRIGEINQQTFVGIPRHRLARAHQYTSRFVASRIATQVQLTSGVQCTLKWTVCQCLHTQAGPASLGSKSHRSRPLHRDGHFLPSPPVRTGLPGIFLRPPVQLLISSPVDEEASLGCAEILSPTLKLFVHTFYHTLESLPQLLMLLSR
jgi:hypothetical protein